MTQGCRMAWRRKMEVFGCALGPRLRRLHQLCPTVIPWLNRKPVSSELLDGLAFVLFALADDCVFEVAAVLRPLLVDLVARAVLPSFRAPADLVKLQQPSVFTWSELCCVVLGKLLPVYPQILRFSIDFFNRSPPFFERLIASVDHQNDAEKSWQTVSQTAHSLLRSHPDVFRTMWNWASFYTLLDTKNMKTKWHTICCIAILQQLSSPEQLLHLLPAESHADVVMSSLEDERMVLQERMAIQQKNDDFLTEPLEPIITASDLMPNTIDVCGILLSRGAYTTAAKTAALAAGPVCGASDELVLTATTRANLRALALALALNSPILLEGVTGAGKTALVEEAARLLGRSDLIKIHLGDQTDGKALLGTYVCTDIPGEFRWQPGLLTRAVTEGRWILVEDIDLAPLDVASILLPLLESRKLFVAARGEQICAASGFQLFATKTSANSKFNTALPVGDNLWTHVLVHTLSDEELLVVIRTLFPRLNLVADRLMKLFQTAKMTRPSEARPLSARDLLKWCSRISVRFPEEQTNAAFIPQTICENMLMEAFDCFFAMLPTMTARLPGLQLLSQELGLSSEYLAFFTSQYKPSIERTATALIVGRVTLNMASVPRRSVVNEETSGVMASFAYTSHTLRQLERLAVAVQRAESILLVGETGAGKTSLVQHLADRVGQRLLVVNLSQQSESADLLGGFKPVDVSRLATPLMEKFELLFARTFSKKANQHFLDSIRKAFTTRRWVRWVSLLSNATDQAQTKLTGPSSIHDSNANTESLSHSNQRPRLDEPTLTELWQSFGGMLNKFAQQRDQIANNFLFSFSEGVLVTAVRSGFWVLLDEVNLASTETLECLSGLLESANGSLVLAERADASFIPRHAEFRVFACMNPATDVGKRDLPPALRSRMTEIFIDEMSAAEDLSQLVRSYLARVTAGASPWSDIVAFYMDAKTLSANGSLLDGANHRPHFSLRTLSRALAYTAIIAPTYGWRRSLYEGLSMAFLTQLNASSAAMLRSKLETSIFRKIDIPSLLNNVPACPTDGAYEKIEQFWISKGPLSDNANPPPPYILTASVQANLRSLARVVVARRFPVLIQGPTSAGKTSMIEYLAHRTGHRFVRVNNHEHTDLQEYLGSYITNTEGRLVFQEGVLVEALRKGYWIVLDELNLAPSDVLEALNRLLDDNRELFIPETQETVRPHPSFMLFATQNPPGVYGGRKVLSRAFRNRFLELHFDDIPQNELATILEQRCRIAPSHALRLVDVYSDLQGRRQSSRLFSGKHGFITLRDLFRWAGRDPTTYQDLANDGYMLLAERVRNVEEKIVVKEVLEKHLKVKIDPAVLYSEEQLKQSSFAPDLMASINKGRLERVVWTPALRRLFLLVSRCLQFNEPVLLVGETGCGKTTICQILAEVLNRQLTVVNCHEHTETADLLGSQRPLRKGTHDPELDSTTQSESSAAHKVLFTWQDGPLVEAMRQGNLFLLDEISLADDSVLERLNSVLEPGRLLVLAEKGSEKVEEIRANKDFAVFATMNPGGDYGKKELSPALRNRFTEIWVPNIDDRENLMQLVSAKLPSWLSFLAPLLLDFLDWFKDQASKRMISLRDILSWVDFICVMNDRMPATESYIQGAWLVLLDSIEASETGPLKQMSTNFLSEQISKLNADERVFVRNFERFVTQDGFFGVGVFKVECGQLESKLSAAFSMDAPTTAANVLRVLRAMQLRKPILLEGPPGVGKTTLVQELAAAGGHHLVRINLSEQTDLSDLFGADLPVEGGEGGEFAWRDGPLLLALKAGYWILLDELNLASQSVLEGLNACLDHRASVYIPEIDLTFSVTEHSRIFACQNPSKQGGGRKGLPKSFLNRFSHVHVQPLSHDDLIMIVQASFPNLDKELLNNLIKFNSQVALATQHGETIGRKGAPWEFNLRDVFRWVKLAYTNPLQSPNVSHLDFARTLPVAYLVRLRTHADRSHLWELFGSIFPEFASSPVPASPVVYVQSNMIVIGDTALGRNDTFNTGFTTTALTPPLQLLSNHAAAAEALLTAVEHGWLALLTGPAASGKTALVRVIAALMNRSLFEFSVNAGVDTTELLGSFEQLDLARTRQSILDRVGNVVRLQVLTLLNKPSQVVALQNMWEAVQNSDNTAKEQLTLLSKLLNQISGGSSNEVIEALLGDVERLQQLENNRVSGRFEWIDGTLLRALESGAWVLLDNVNFCSPAVLDRLNPLLEPSGVLAVSERGLVDGQIKLVRPHPNFRIFLAMDPSHGEISRAMRNRALEISILQPKSTPVLPSILPLVPEQILSVSRDLDILSPAADDVIDLLSLLTGLGLDSNLARTIISFRSTIAAQLQQSGPLSHAALVRVDDWRELLLCTRLVLEQLQRGVSLADATTTAVAIVYRPVLCPPLDPVQLDKAWSAHYEQHLTATTHQLHSSVVTPPLRDLSIRLKHPLALSLIVSGATLASVAQRSLSDDRAVRFLLPSVEYLLAQATHLNARLLGSIAYSLAPIQSHPFIDWRLRQIASDPILAEYSRWIEAQSQSSQHFQSWVSSLLPTQPLNLDHWLDFLQRRFEHNISITAVSQILVLRERIAAHQWQEAIVEENSHNTAPSKLCVYQKSSAYHHRRLDPAAASHLALPLIQPFTQALAVVIQKLLVEWLLNIFVVTDITALESISNSALLTLNAVRLLAKFRWRLVSNLLDTQVFDVNHVTVYVRHILSILNKTPALQPLWTDPQVSHLLQRLQDALLLDALDAWGAIYHAGGHPSLWRHPAIAHAAHQLEVIDHVRHAEERMLIVEALTTLRSLNDIIEDSPNALDHVISSFGESTPQALLDSISTLAQHLSDQLQRDSLEYHLSNFEFLKMIHALRAQHHNLSTSATALVQPISTSTMLHDLQQWLTWSISTPWNDKGTKLAPLAAVQRLIWTEGKARDFGGLWLELAIGWQKKLWETSGPLQLFQGVASIYAMGINQPLEFVSLKASIEDLTQRKQLFEWLAQHDQQDSVDLSTALHSWPSPTMTFVAAESLKSWSSLLVLMSYCLISHKPPQAIVTELIALATSTLHSLPLIQAIINSLHHTTFSLAIHPRIRANAIAVLSELAQQTSEGTSVAKQIFHLGRAWFFLSRMWLQSFLLPQAVDPTTPARVDLTDTNLDISQTAEALVVAIAQDSTQRGVSPSSLSVLSAHAAALVKDLRESYAAKDLVARDVVVRPTQPLIIPLQQEMAQLESLLLEHGRVDQLLDSLSHGLADSNFERQEHIQQQLLQAAIDRLTSRYPGYEDLVVPVIWSMYQAKFGLRLSLAAAQSELVNQNQPHRMLIDALQFLARYPQYTSSLIEEHDVLSHLTEPVALYSARDVFAKAASNSSHDNNQLLRLVSASSFVDYALALLHRVHIRARSDIDRHVAVNTATKLFQAFADIWQRAEDTVVEREGQENEFYKFRVRSTQIQTDDELDVIAFKSAFPDHSSLFAEFSEKNGLEETKQDAAEPSTKKPAQDAVFLLERQQQAIYDLHLAIWLNTTPASVQDNTDMLNACYHAVALLVAVLKGQVPRFLDLIAHGAHLVAAESSIKLLESTDEIQKDGYSFYHSANVAEAQQIVPVLTEMNAQACVLLTEWPEHAVLLALTKIIERILSFPVTSPLSQLITGLELLLQRAQDWEEYASTAMSLKVHLNACAQLIIRWRRLEVQSWPTLLAARAKAHESGISRSWFILYRLLHTPVSGEAAQAQFAEVLKSLNDFMQTSTIGTFNARLRLLYAFAAEMSFMATTYETDSDERRHFDTHYRLLSNLSWYYAQFASAAARELEQRQAPLEKELRNVVKLARWNDLNYHALKQSADKSHRTLGRFLRKFNEILNLPFMTVLTKVRETPEPSLTSAPTDETTQSNQRLVSSHRSIADIIDKSVQKVFLQAVPSVDAESAQPMSATLPLHERLPLLLRRVLQHCTGAGDAVNVIPVNDVITVNTISSTIVERVQGFRAKDAAQAYSEETASIFKAIKTQKQRALTDLLKNLSLIGLSYHRGAVAPQHATAIYLFSQPIVPLKSTLATWPLPGAQELESLWSEADRYHERTLARLSSLRDVARGAVVDLTRREIERGAGFAEHLTHIVLQQRTLLVDLAERFDNLRPLLTAVADIAETHGVTKSSGALNTLKLQLALFNHALLVLNQLQRLHPLPQRIQEQISKCIEQRNASVVLVAQYHAPYPPHVIGATVSVTINNNQTTLLELRQIAAESGPKFKVIADLLASELSHVAETREQVGTTDWTDVDAAIQQYLLSIQAIVHFEKKENANTSDDIDIDMPAVIEPKLLVTLHKNFVTVLSSFTTTTTSNLAWKALAQLALGGETTLKKYGPAFRVLVESHALTFERYTHSFLVFHRSTCKLAYIVTNLMEMLATKGFCSPSAIEENDADGKGELKADESGTGMGEGQGKNDVSNQIEDEEQVLGTRDEQPQNQGEGLEHEEDNGLEMQNDFDGQLYDRQEKDNDQENNDDDKDEQAEQEDQMGETNQNAEVLDNHLWDDASEEGNDSDVEENTKDTDQQAPDGNRQPESESKVKAKDSSTDDQKRQKPHQPSSIKDEKSANEDEDSAKDHDESNTNEDSMMDNDTTQHDEQESQNNADVSKNETSGEGDVEDKAENPTSPQNNADAMELDEKNPSKDDNDNGGAENTLSDEEPEQQEEPVDDDMEDDTINNEGQLGPDSDMQPMDDHNAKEDHVENEDDGNFPDVMQLDGDEKDDNAQKNDPLGAEEQDKDDFDLEQPDDRRGDDHANVAQGDKPIELAKDLNESLPELGKDVNTTPMPTELSHDANATLPEPSTDANSAAMATDGGEQGAQHDLTAAKESNSGQQKEGQTPSFAPQQQQTRDEANPHRSLEASLREWQQRLRRVQDSDKPASRHNDQQKDQSNQAEPNSMQQYEHIQADATAEDALTLAAATKEQAQDQNQRRIIGNRVNEDEDDKSDEDMIVDQNINIPGELDSAQAVAIYQQLERSTHDLALELCESLRLILEPTLASKLRGDYRTGKRLNMKKIIPYVASQFKKDKIWLRRTRPAKRQYQVLIAVDDSRSMVDAQATQIALETVVLLARALTQLEVGDVGIVGFGETVELVHPFDQPFSSEAGCEVVKRLRFQQNKTFFGRLVDRSLALFAEVRQRRANQGNAPWQLQIIVSDGAILDEDRAAVAKLVRRATEQRILLVCIALDTRAHSILDLKDVKYNAGGQMLFTRYMDTFPFEYFIVLRDVNALPIILADALRQWFEILRGVDL